jgi:hypothetical protein
MANHGTDTGGTRRSGRAASTTGSKREICILGARIGKVIVRGCMSAASIVMLRIVSVGFVLYHIHLSIQDVYDQSTPVDNDLASIRSPRRNNQRQTCVRSEARGKLALEAFRADATAQDDRSGGGR